MTAGVEVEEGGVGEGVFVCVIDKVGVGVGFEVAEGVTPGGKVLVCVIVGVGVTTGAAVMVMSGDQPEVGMKLGLVLGFDGLT